MNRLILGESEAVRELTQLIHRVAKSRTNILIVGESGTGKELVARMIHNSSELKTKPFIAVNCGAISENLIESEMFGHCRGSFTGAVQEKAGLFEAANGGTLFLDEIGELPLGMQVKLLRAIQERVFRKVGGLEDIKVNVRIIAATNRDLEAAVHKNTFREDLYYRLNVIQIRTPPLRERKSDIVLLAEHFLKKFAERNHKSILGFEKEAVLALQNHQWPGNVRELENCVERAVALENSNRIGLGSLPPELQELTIEINGDGQAKVRPEIRLVIPDFSKETIDLEDTIQKIEKVFVLAALESAKGSQKKAAALLGIPLRSLRYRLQKLTLTN